MLLSQRGEGKEGQTPCFNGVAHACQKDISDVSNAALGRTTGEDELVIPLLARAHLLYGLWIELPIDRVVQHRLDEEGLVIKVDSRLRGRPFGMVMFVRDETRLAIVDGEVEDSGADYDEEQERPEEWRQWQHRECAGG